MATEVGQCDEEVFDPSLDCEPITPRVTYNLYGGGQYNAYGLPSSTDYSMRAFTDDSIEGLLTDNTVYWADEPYYFPYSGPLDLNGIGIENIKGVIRLDSATIENSEGNWAGSLASDGLQPGEYYVFVVEGDVTLKTGDIVFGTAGKGICLGVTSNTDANTLDDYEEGTWTAGFSGASVSGGNTTGYYIRVGRICHYQYYSGAMTFSSISGTGTVTGLPFTTSNLGYAAGTYVHGDAWGDSDGIHLGLNATNIYCVIAGATSYRDFVAGSKYLMITGTYIIKEGS